MRRHLLGLRHGARDPACRCRGASVGLRPCRACRRLRCPWAGPVLVEGTEVIGRWRSWVGPQTGTSDDPITNRGQELQCSPLLLRVPAVAVLSQPGCPPIMSCLGHHAPVPPSRRTHPCYHEQPIRRVIRSCRCRCSRQGAMPPKRNTTHLVHCHAGGRQRYRDTNDDPTTSTLQPSTSTDAATRQLAGGGVMTTAEQPRRRGSPVKMPRSRGAASGLVLVLLGIWGGLIPFVGPYFNYAFGTTAPWVFSFDRLWLNTLPGAARRGTPTCPGRVRWRRSRCRWTRRRPGRSRTGRRSPCRSSGPPACGRCGCRPRLVLLGLGWGEVGATDPAGDASGGQHGGRDPDTAAGPSGCVDTSVSNTGWCVLISFVVLLIGCSP